MAYSNSGSYKAPNYEFLGQNYQYWWKKSKNYANIENFGTISVPPERPQIQIFYIGFGFWAQKIESLGLKLTKEQRENEILYELGFKIYLQTKGTMIITPPSTVKMEFNLQVSINYVVDFVNPNGSDLPCINKFETYCSLMQSL